MQHFNGFLFIRNFYLEIDYSQLQILLHSFTNSIIWLVQFALILGIIVYYYNNTHIIIAMYNSINDMHSIISTIFYKVNEKQHLLILEAIFFHYILMTYII